MSRKGPKEGDPRNFGTISPERRVGKRAKPPLDRPRPGACAFFIHRLVAWWSEQPRGGCFTRWSPAPFHGALFRQLSARSLFPIICVKLGPGTVVPIEPYSCLSDPCFRGRYRFHGLCRDGLRTGKADRPQTCAGCNRGKHQYCRRQNIRRAVRDRVWAEASWDAKTMQAK